MIDEVRMHDGRDSSVRMGGGGVCDSKCRKSGNIDDFKIALLSSPITDRCKPLLPAPPSLSVSFLSVILIVTAAAYRSTPDCHAVQT